MKRRLTIVLMVCLFGLFSGISAAEQLRIANEGEYPPFNLTNAKGQLEGFDIDIANAICQAMKVEPVFVVQDWNGIIPGLLAKKYDCIISSMSITEERKKQVDFTDPYYQVPARFVTKTDSGLIVSKEGLKGKRVGVQRATTYANYLEGELAGVVQIVYYDNIESHNMDLASGRLDAVLGQAYLMGKWLESPEGKGFGFVGDPVSDPKYIGYGAGIAVRKDDQKLRERINAALHQIIADGTHKRIASKYFSFDLLQYKK
jgi:lysine-arginine-ornithine-binding protein